MPKAPAAKKKKYDDEEGADKKEDKKKKDKQIPRAARFSLKFLTMLKQIQLEVSSTNGTTLPGYREGIDYLGLSHKYRTPGLQFIGGLQDDKIRYKLAQGGHLSQNPLQINQYIQLNGLDIKGSGTLEPFDGFRINLNFDQQTQQHQL